MKYFYLIVLLVLSYSLLAQAPKFSNEFLSLGIGARAHGMGTVHAALSNDHTSTYWNPAGLTRIQKPFQIGAMHAEWFAGIGKLDYIGFGIRTGKNEETGLTRSALGISTIRFGIDDIPNTFDLVGSDGSINYDNIRPFSAADYAFGISYAYQLIQPKKTVVKVSQIQQLSIGSTVKVIHRTVGPFAKAWGFGLDLGMQYQVGRLQVGVMARDITSTFNAWNYSFTPEQQAILGTTGNVIPENSIEITLPKISAGAAYTIPLGKTKRIYPFTSKASLTASVEVDITSDGERNTVLAFDPVSIDPKAGLELEFLNIIFLRGGIKNIQSSIDGFDPNKTVWTWQPNAGVGLKFWRLAVDYAYTDVGNFAQTDYSHIVSLTLNFDERDKSEKPKEDILDGDPKKPPVNNEPSDGRPKIILEQID